MTVFSTIGHMHVMAFSKHAVLNVKSAILLEPSNVIHCNLFTEME